MRETHSVWIGEDVWDLVKRRAHEDRVTVRTWLERAVCVYVARHPVADPRVAGPGPRDLHAELEAPSRLSDVTPEERGRPGAFTGSRSEWSEVERKVREALDRELTYEPESER